MEKVLSFFSVLFSLFLIACQPRVSPLLNTENENTYIVAASQRSDSTLLNYIQPFRDSLQSAMGQKVVVLPRKITHSRNNPHTLIGPWLCDILLVEGKERFPGFSVDGALYNPGGIRLPQLQDTVRVKDIYELLPFDNTLVLLELSGNLLREWIDHTVQRGGWPMSETFDVYVSNKTETRILIQNQPIDPDKTYRIVTNDYVATGGDNCGFLKGSEVVRSSAFIRDIVIDHFDKGNAPDIPREARIHFMIQNK
jgi:2',3'-cyclic-nucleotide 2'-phosphodiesterase (5'-nucleotidase family)